MNFLTWVKPKPIFFIVITFTLIFFSFHHSNRKRGKLFFRVLLNPSFYNFFGCKKNRGKKSYFIRLALGHPTTKAYSFPSCLTSHVLFCFQEKDQTKIRWPLHFPQYSNTSNNTINDNIVRLRVSLIKIIHDMTIVSNYCFDFSQIWFCGFKDYDTS